MNHSTPTILTEFSHRGKVDNNDMNMRPESLELMDTRVRAAMGNATIKAAFCECENIANRAKYWHELGGRLSLFLLIVVLEVALLRLAAGSYAIGQWIKPVTIVAVLLGIIPFACTLILRLFGVHERWVEARFKAERIRHWKFQQLLDGRYMEALQPAPQPLAVNGEEITKHSSVNLDTQDGAKPEPIDEGFERRWDTLVTDMNLGLTGMKQFVKTRPFTSPLGHQSTPHIYQDEKVFRSAASVYRQFRVMVQVRWFDENSEKYGKRDARTGTTARLLLFLSAFTALAEGVLHVLVHFHSVDWESPYLDPGLAVAGIAMVVLSAGIRVYRSASGISENAERYKRLSMNIDWYTQDFDSSIERDVIDTDCQHHVLRLMEKIEHLCHGELTEFIRVAEKSDYLM